MGAAIMTREDIVSVINRQYKQYQVRELIELTKDSFLPMLFNQHAPYAVYHDGMLWMVSIANDDLGEALQYADILLLSNVYYCNITLDKVLKSTDNLKMPVVRIDSHMLRSLAYMVKNGCADT